ncbi:MAG: 50S ribosomal protein L25 [Acidobacteria bacterium]|nr:50S ribosomal protein L25 [Acidobacteriota bacterium]
MITDITINANVRDGIGKGFARRLRAQGMIPVAVYGEGQDPVAIAVNAKEIAQILRSETGHNSIFNLVVGEGAPSTVIIKDWYVDPVKGKLLHADLMRLSLTETTRVKVSIEAIGEAIGVKMESGILDLSLREIEIECLPSDIPDHLQVDVSGLRLGDHVTVADLVYDRTKVKVLVDETQVVAGILTSRLSEAVEAPAEGETTGSEPEVIKKGKGEE